MKKTRFQSGFSLIELLLVLAIIAILSGIAIPAFIGQRRRARIIGDAQTNARALMMALEARKAENGVYGTKGTYDWTASGAVPTTSTNPAPTFLPKDNSKMNYKLVIGSTTLTYTITVTDPTITSKPTVLTGDQTGAIVVDATYSK